MNKVGLYGTQGVYPTCSPSARRTAQYVEYKKAEQKKDGTKKIVAALAGLAVIGAAGAGIVKTLKTGKMSVKLEDVTEGLRSGIAKNKAGRPITGTVMENLDDGGSIQRTFVKGQLVEKIELANVDGKKVKTLSQYNNGKKTLRQINKYEVRLDDDGHVIKDLSNTKGYVKGTKNTIVDLATGQPNYFEGSVDDFKTANFSKIQNASDNLAPAVPDVPMQSLADVAQTPIDTAQTALAQNPLAQANVQNNAPVKHKRYLRAKNSAHKPVSSQGQAQVSINNAAQTPIAPTAQALQAPKTNTQTVATSVAPNTSNVQTVAPKINNSTQQAAPNIAQPSATTGSRLEQLKYEYSVIDTQRKALKANPCNTSGARKKQQEKLNALNTQIGEIRKQIALEGGSSA